MPGGRLGYLEPIYLQAMCLQCHGSDLGSGVRERLAELYPEDRATGFAEGDFRGMFWVVVPIDPGSGKASEVVSEEPS